MQQIRRSFRSIIARAGLATAALSAGGVAMAADISWSVGIASPGYQVVVTQAPPVVVHQPVVVVQQPRVRVHQPVVVVQQPRVRVHQPVVVVQQPRVRVHRPVVTHVAQPRVVYNRAPAFTQGQGHRSLVARDAGRHGYKNKHKTKPRHYRHDRYDRYDRYDRHDRYDRYDRYDRHNRHNRHGNPPGYDGNWGNN